MHRYTYMHIHEAPKRHVGPWRQWWRQGPARALATGGKFSYIPHDFYAKKSVKTSEIWCLDLYFFRHWSSLVGHGTSWLCAHDHLVKKFSTSCTKETTRLMKGMQNHIYTSPRRTGPFVFRAKDLSGKEIPRWAARRASFFLLRYKRLLCSEF
jgi:hypothetical protein